MTNGSESGGIGRHAGFRTQWGNLWGFESPLSHQASRMPFKLPHYGETGYTALRLKGVRDTPLLRKLITDFFRFFLFLLSVDISISEKIFAEVLKMFGSYGFVLREDYDCSSIFHQFHQEFLDVNS